MSASLRSSGSSSAGVSSPSDEDGVLDTSSALTDDHPLNLTKRRDLVPDNDSPGREVPDPVTYPDVDRPSPSCRPPSFSLKTSPSKFLSSPADDERRVGSRQVDGGWSQVQLGGGAIRPLQPAYDNSAASMMLPTSPSVLDRVSDICVGYSTQKLNKSRAVVTRKPRDAVRFAYAQ